MMTVQPRLETSWQLNHTFASFFFSTRNLYFLISWSVLNKWIWLLVWTNLSSGLINQSPSKHHPSGAVNDSFRSFSCKKVIKLFFIIFFKSSFSQALLVLSNETKKEFKKTFTEYPRDKHLHDVMAFQPINVCVSLTLIISLLLIIILIYSFINFNNYRNSLHHAVDYTS